MIQIEEDADTPLDQSAASLLLQRCTSCGTFQPHPKRQGAPTDSLHIPCCINCDQPLSADERASPFTYYASRAASTPRRGEKTDETPWWWSPGGRERRAAEDQQNNTRLMLLPFSVRSPSIVFRPSVEYADSEPDASAIHHGYSHADDRNGFTSPSIQRRTLPETHRHQRTGNEAAREDRGGGAAALVRRALHGSLASSTGNLSSTIYSAAVHGGSNVVRMDALRTTPLLGRQDDNDRTAAAVQHSSAAKIRKLLLLQSSASLLSASTAAARAVSPLHSAPANVSSATKNSATGISSERATMLLERARHLTRVNRERLAQRFFSRWVLHCNSRKRRSIFSTTPSRVPPSTHEGGTRGSELSPSPRQRGNSIEQLAASPRPTNEVLQSAVLALWQAHEDHAKCVKSVLDGIVDAPLEGPLPLRFLDTSPARADTSQYDVDSATPDTLRDVTRHSDDRRVSSERRHLAAAASGLDVASRRPLQHIVALQGSQAVQLFSRQEDTARREVLREEVTCREALEVTFFVDRDAVASREDARRRNGVSAAVQPRRSVADVVYELEERQAENRRQALEGLAMTARNAASQRELELDVARTEGGEQIARKLIAVSQTNAWVSLQGAMQESHQTAQQRTLERNERSQRRVAAAAAVARTPLSSASIGAGRAAEASSPLVGENSSIGSPSRPRSSSTVRFVGADGAQVSDREPQHSSSSAVRPRRASVATVDDLVQDTSSISPSTLRRTHSTVQPAASPASAGTVAILSDELKGRKQLVKLYRDGLQHIIQMFASSR